MNTIMWTTCISKIVWSAKQYIKNMWTKCIEIYGGFNNFPVLISARTASRMKKRMNQPI